MNARHQLLMLTAALLSVAGLATAADDIFLDLKDAQGLAIKGESTDSRHKEKIVIASFALGVASTAGKVTFNGLQLGKQIDRTSPLLYLNCAQGNRLREATLIVRKAGVSGGTPVEFYTIKMFDVLISSVQTQGHDSGDPPTEAFSLTFGKVEFTYNQQDASGNLTPVTTKWDLVNNAPIP